MGPGISTSLKKVASMGRQEIVTNLQNSPSFREIAKLERGASPEGNLVISSVFTCLLKMAWIDRELSNHEVKYLMREFKDWCKFDDATRKRLIDFHSTLVRRNPKFNTFVPYHFALLNHLLDSDRKIKLLENLIIICRSDLEFKRTEENLVENLATFYEIPSATYKEMLLNAKFIILQRLNAVREDESQEELDKPYDLPEIKIDF